MKLHQREKRYMKHRKTIVIGFAVLVFVIAFIFTLLSGATFTAQPDDTIDFSRVIRDNVSPDVRVVDIAMLGAHNAFTDRISPGSAIAPYNTNAFVSPVVNTIAPGLVSRLMVCQKSDAYGLLMRGVRYFDVRLVYYNGSWYTHHTLISAPLQVYLTQIIYFLNKNPGELIVFDIQHARLGDRSFEDLWRYIASITVGGCSLFDFVNYAPYNTPLGELTLGHATQYGAGVVILARTPVAEDGFHYEYNTSIRSMWHNEIRTHELIEGIQKEYQFLTQNPLRYRNLFRVNQAQTTPNFDSFGNAVYTLFSWSVLSHNARHNVWLIEHENFTHWLTAMPIFMVDFSDSARGNFNVEVIEKINGFNRNM